MTKPWKEFQPEIVRLYIHEGRTLKDVQDIMKREHNFNASIRSYRQQFDHWRVGKYKCKRKTRHVEYSAAVTQPPSPPITPILPPMSLPAYEQRPFSAPMPTEHIDDGEWPSSRSNHYAERGHRHIKRESISLPVYTQPAPVIPYRGTHTPYRSYQTPRTSRPIMSPPGDDVSSGWFPGRVQFPASEPTSRAGASLYSPPRDPSPLMLARDHSSYSEGRPGFSDDADWVVHKPEPYAPSDSDGSLQGESLFDSRRRVHTDAFTSSRSLACARGCLSTSCCCDRVNGFYRGG